MHDNIINKTSEMADENSTVSEVKAPPKKRGRKPNPNKKVYFGEEEERAFVEYVNCTDETQKDRIFAQKLYFF